MKSIRTIISRYHSSQQPRCSFASRSTSTSFSSLPQLRIVAFNDVYELDHLPHVQTVIRQYQPQLVVLAGDFLSPSTLSSMDGGKGMITTLRSIGVTHLCLGNHEADITSLAKLHRRLLKFGTNVTILNSNIARGPLFTNENNNNNKNDEDSEVGLIPDNEQQQQRKQLIQQQLQQTPAWLRGQPDDGNENSVPVTTPSPTTTTSSTVHHPTTTTSFMPEYAIVTTPCQRVRIALMGLLSDEPNIFRDNTFRGAPIANVVQTYQHMYQRLVQPHTPSTTTTTSLPNTPPQQDHPLAHIIIPITHQSIQRDTELATRMMELSKTNGVIIGGHDHVPYNVTIEPTNINHHSTPSQQQQSVQILKSGCNAATVHVIDLTFDLSTPEILVDRHVELVDVTKYAPSIIVTQIVQEQKSILEALETQDIVPTSTAGSLLPPGAILSSRGTRYRQTTVGALFCTAIKEELEVDVAIINGATIKGETDYTTTSMSYASLKKELPFPTKIVVVPMKRWELHDAIHYSRTRNPDVTPEEELVNQYYRNQVYGKNHRNNDNNDAISLPSTPLTSPDISSLPPTRIERKGYIQVDTEFDRIGFHTGHQDDDLMVALPRNLLGGFCNIVPLMQVGQQLKGRNIYPTDDDQYIRAIDLIVRHFCKERWFEMIHELQFTDIDTEQKGYISRSDVKRILTQTMGQAPASFVVDDMIAAMDVDQNGIIDAGEFSYLLATMERERNLAPIRFD